MIVLAAVMIFGKNLPEVAVKAAAQFVRLRRAVTKMWREAGIDEEIRRVQREVDRAKLDLPSLDEESPGYDASLHVEHTSMEPDGEEKDPWIRGEGEVDDSFHLDPSDGPEGHCEHGGDPSYGEVAADAVDGRREPLDDGDGNPPPDPQGPEHEGSKEPA